MRFRVSSRTFEEIEPCSPPKLVASCHLRQGGCGSLRGKGRPDYFIAGTDSPSIFWFHFNFRSTGEESKRPFPLHIGQNNIRFVWTWTLYSLISMTEISAHSRVDYPPHDSFRYKTFVSALVMDFCGFCPAKVF